VRGRGSAIKLSITSGSAAPITSARSVRRSVICWSLPETMGDEALSAAPEAGAALDLCAACELAHQLLAQVRADPSDPKSVGSQGPSVRRG
jgi:hypothetical protein